MVSLYVSVLGMSSFAQAAVPREQITQWMNTQLSSLLTEEAFTRFAKKYIHYQSENQVSVLVKPEEIQIKNEKYTLGLAIKAVKVDLPMDKVKRILSTPKLYQSIYNIDAPADLGFLPDFSSFRARIFKKIPVLSNQDYVLDYKPTQVGETWFLRAKLHKDNEDFALRDNLTMVNTTTANSVVVNNIASQSDKTTQIIEVSYVYILNTLARLAGPQTRKIMQTEIRKAALAFACICDNEEIKKSEERSEVFNTLISAAAKDCWKKQI